MLSWFPVVWYLDGVKISFKFLTELRGKNSFSLGLECNDATDVWQIRVRGDNKWKTFLGFLNLGFKQIVSGNSGGPRELIVNHKGTVGTEEQWVQRNSGHRGTVGTEEQWAQRNIGHRGTRGTSTSK